MKVVVAIDSLKGSLSSVEAGLAIKDGILDVKPDANVVVKPLADGGEGTTDALVEGMFGKRINVVVHGPLKEKVSCYYGYIKENNMAILEMASAAGITLVPEEKKNPLYSTTYGVGEMITHAMNFGCRNFIIGIGGSATNDGGIGMLRALGFIFLDKYGNDVGEGAQALSRIASIDLSQKNPLLKECNFQVACDVKNHLYGKNGATYVFGPQKGVTDEMKEVIDQGMKNYANVAADVLKIDNSQIEGTGAAGGLGFAFYSFLNAKLVSGIDLILDTIGLEKELQDADIVVTGEGRLDFQTAMGKAPIGVAKVAKKYNTKVIAFAGSVTDEAVACNEKGIDAFFPILRNICTLEDAMKPENARANMRQTVAQVFRLLP